MQRHSATGRADTKTYSAHNAETQRTSVSQESQLNLITDNSPTKGKYRLKIEDSSETSDTFPVQRIIDLAIYASIIIEIAPKQLLQLLNASPEKELRKFYEKIYR